MSQPETFENKALMGQQKLTTADVARMFNDLQKSLKTETFSFSTKLSRPEGGTAVGFSYTGSVAGAGLRDILRATKIDYAVVMYGGIGANENSEIQIDEDSEKKMLDLMNRLRNYATANNQKQKTA